jgi:hypothetical protein
MPEFTIGDSVSYTPSFGTPKPVIVSSSSDGSGYIDIQFVDLGDFQEFRDMGISEVVSEMDRIGRVPESTLSFSMPMYYEEQQQEVQPINIPPRPTANFNVPQNTFEGGRRRRPSSRSRRRRVPRRRLSRRH